MRAHTFETRWRMAIDREYGTEGWYTVFASARCPVARFVQTAHLRDHAVMTGRGQDDRSSVEAVRSLGVGVL